MKTFLMTCLIGFVLPFFSEAQTMSTRKFIKRYKKGSETTTNLWLPALVFDLGKVVAQSAAENTEEREATKLLGKIKSMRILVMEDENRVSENDIKRLVNNLQSNDYEPLITVRDGSTNFHLLLHEKNGKLKKMMLLVAEPDEFVLLKIRTKLKPKHLRQLIQVLNEQHDLPTIPQSDEPENVPEDTFLIRA